MNLKGESTKCSHSSLIDNYSFTGSPDLLPDSPSIRTATHLETSSLTNRRASSIRREHELAGGIEDWEDVHGEDVDRYGFITKRKAGARGETPDARAPQRVSTVSRSILQA